MKSEELRQYLETRQKSLSEKEFFATIIEMLDGDPSDEAREVLDSYLLTYSFVDEDRVARYWEKFLSHPDPLQGEFAALKLSILARKPNSLAYKILTQFLGEEPTEDRIEQILKERMLRIFPRGDGEE